MTRSRARRVVCALAAGLAVAVMCSSTVAGSSPPKPRDTSIGAGGMTGSKVGSTSLRVDPVNLPARVGRFAAVPTKQELWAIGQVTKGGGNQPVFLQKIGAGPWRVTGPPVDAAGRPVNTHFFGLALTSSGEGWAVATAGMFHHVAGGPWVLDPCACSGLEAVAVTPDGSRGFAVGSGATVLRLDRSSGAATWTSDLPVTDTVAVQDELIAVGVTATDAWTMARKPSSATSTALELFQRGSSAWNRVHVPSAQGPFDATVPTLDQSNQVQLSPRGSAIAVDGNTFWFGGTLSPVDPVNPTGDPTTANSSSRPFTLRWTADSGFTGYCPVTYTTSNDQVAPANVCAQRMPLSPYGVTSLAVAGSDLYAGGFGLFHFQAGRWFREPDPVGTVISLAFSSAADGWLAAGDAGGSLIADTSSIVAGHLTTQPPTRHMARWPQFNQEVLLGAGVAPDGARALAVGMNGATEVFEPSTGWQNRVRRTDATFEAAAFVDTDNAWAVGSSGTLLHFDKGVSDADAIKVGGATLFGVAFSGGTGFAVGSNGTILHYAGGAWSVDPSSGKTGQLNAIAALPGTPGFAAVGDGGTVLVNPTGAAGGWQTVAAPATLSNQKLFAVTGIGTGEYVAGGASSTMLRGDGGGSIAPFDAPVEGTVLALASRPGPGVRLFASIADPKAVSKFSGSAPKVTQGWVSYYDGSGWTDIDLSHRVGLSTDFPDGPLVRDPVYGLAADPRSGAAWGVGGRPAGSPADDGVLPSQPTSSIFKIDVDGDPAPPDTVAAPVLPSGPGLFNFAFYSETGCGKPPPAAAPLCSMEAGLGQSADTVATTIQDEINSLTGRPGGPRFVVFGGDGRGQGLPEDQAQFAAYLSNFKLPVFGGPGGRDSYASASANKSIQPIPGRDPVSTPDSSQLVATNRFYEEELSDQADPWGLGKGEAGFFSTGNATGTAGRARTHYAFDYRPVANGPALARFVFVDSSNGSISAPAAQNPNEPQTSWLSTELGNALTAGIPTIVVTSTPTRDPTTFANNPLMVDGTAFESTALAETVSAVFSGRVRVNALYHEPESGILRVPFYVSGGGGAPLDGLKDPSDGHYNAWLLVTVDSSKVSTLNPQAQVTVRAMPTLESLALQAPSGTTVAGGNRLTFSAMGRFVDGAGPVGDNDQVRRTYVRFPLNDTCDSNGDQNNAGCVAPRAIPPDYHFVTSDPTIAQFVSPRLVNGRMVPDDQSNLLCTYRTGTVTVSIISGIHKASLPITVTPGQGQCVPNPVKDPPEPPANVDPLPDKIDPPPDNPPPHTPPPPPPPAPKPILHAPPPAQPVPPPPVQEVALPKVVAKPVPKPFVPPQLAPQPSPVVVPPAPSMVPSPAPPASASAAGAEKQEDEEAETESAGQDSGQSEARAIRHERPGPYNGAEGWAEAGSALLLAFLAAHVAAAARSLRKKPAERWVQP